MSFNIEDFINNLPDNTTDIDVSYRGLKYLPNLLRFTNLQTYKH
jgi:hypothetical protein